MNYFKAKKYKILLPVTWQKNNGLVGRQNFSFLLMYFFDSRKKSQPLTHLSVNKSVEERKN